MPRVITIRFTRSRRWGVFSQNTVNHGVSVIVDVIPAKPMPNENNKSSAVPGFAIIGLLTTGCLSLLCSVGIMNTNQQVAGGVFAIAVAIAFGQLFNGYARS